MKVPEGMKEFRALMLKWDTADSNGRTGMLETIAEQVDPLELFVLESVDETRERFGQLRTALQFANWLFRNDMDGYQMFRSMPIRRVLTEEMRERRAQKLSFRITEGYEG